jgi:hypothetical protein
MAKKSAFFGARPLRLLQRYRHRWFSKETTIAKKNGPSLVRPRSGKNEPSRGLGCRFVDQNVAHVSHTPCRRPQYCTVAHKRHAQEHRVENWSYSASPALTRRRWHGWLHGWLQEVRHLPLPLLGRLLLSCCVSCCAGPPQASGCCSSTDAPGLPESSAGESDKPALSFSWFSLCVAAANGVSFVCIITLHSSVNPLL